MDRPDPQYGVSTQAHQLALEEMAPQKDKVVAGVLGILLGAFGFHRFYLGYIWIGLAQIAVTVLTFGIGAVWGITEGILILIQDDWTDADGRPLGSNPAASGSIKAHIGKEGEVTRAITTRSIEGKVRLGLEEFSANSSTDIPVGRRVKVIDAEGIHLTVEELPSRLPELPGKFS